MELLTTLVVTDADPSLDYDRGDWGSGWSDADGDCQDTRQEVLIEESVSPTILEDGGCRVDIGSWYGAFTDTWFDDPGDLDIDHFVPLANAHRSGGWAWDRNTKQTYANDLEDPGHLIAVSSSANRSKGARGPEDWTPDHPGYLCTYATTWIRIKVRWSLTVTPAGTTPSPGCWPAATGRSPSTRPRRHPPRPPFLRRRPPSSRQRPPLPTTRPPIPGTR